MLGLRQAAASGRLVGAPAAAWAWRTRVGTSWAPRALGGRMACTTYLALHSCYHMALIRERTPPSLYHITCGTQLTPHRLHYIRWLV
eukprot:5089348-Pyramimonas_sp.AAC.1